MSTFGDADRLPGHETERPVSCGQAETLRALTSVHPMVLRIAAARHTTLDNDLVNYNNPYDLMLWRYIGHPHLWKKPDYFPEVRRNSPGNGGIVYDRPERASCSDRHIVYAARSSGVDPESILAKIVVTGDMDTGEITEWFVVEEETIGDPFRPGTTFGTRWYLDDRLLHSVPVPEDNLPPWERGVLEAAIREIDIMKMFARRMASRPRLEFTNQGGFFVPRHGADPETLTPIAEINNKLGVFYRDFLDQFSAG